MGLFKLLKRRHKKSNNNIINDNNYPEVKSTEKFQNLVDDNDDENINTKRNNDDNDSINNNVNGSGVVPYPDKSKQKMNGDSKKRHYFKLEEGQDKTIRTDQKVVHNNDYERRKEETPIETKLSLKYDNSNNNDSNNNGIELQFGNFDALYTVNGSPTKKNDSNLKIESTNNNNNNESKALSDIATFDQVCFTTTETVRSEANGTDEIDSVFGSLGQFSDFAYDKFITIPPSLSTVNDQPNQKNIPPPPPPPPRPTTTDDNNNNNDDDNMNEKDDSGNYAEYDKACELLHKHLIRKNHTLTQSERDFLRHLIEADKTNENTVQDIETASLTLQDDALFPTPKMSQIASKVSTKSSNGEEEVIQREEKQNEKLETKSETIHNSDNSLGTTKLKIVSESLPNILDLETKSSESLENMNKHADSSVLSDDDSDDETVSTTSSIIRFDGWHDNMEETGYDFMNFQILGTSAVDDGCKPHVLSPPLMEVLQGFLPHSLTESNFWLKYSLIRDGSSSYTLQSKCRASKYTLIGVETLEGEVFGSFTSSPWQKQKSYFGNGEAFLWRMKKPRRMNRHLLKTFSENILEIYPHTGNDDYCQLFLPNQSILCVGGGEWKSKFENPHHTRNDNNNHDNNHGFGLMIDVDRLYGESWPSSTFANPSLCKLPTNAHSFEILNMEVWTFTTCIREEEATNVEMRKFFIENNHNNNNQVAP